MYTINDTEQSNLLKNFSIKKTYFNSIPTNVQSANGNMCAHMYVCSKIPIEFLI